jgi:hypothetical protein
MEELNTLLKPYSEKSIDTELFVEDRWGALKFGIDLSKEPTRLNVFSRERGAHVMGFGSNSEEAYLAGLSKLEERLRIGSYDCIQVTNGVTLNNGSNVQCALSGILYKLDPKYI